RGRPWMGPGGPGAVAVRPVSTLITNIGELVTNAPDASTRPVQPGPVQPGPVQPGPVQPGPVQPGPVQPGPVQPGPVQPGPVQPGPVQPGPVQPGPVQPGPVQPGPALPGPVQSGPGSFAVIEDAALVVEAGRVAWTGPAAEAPAADEVIDCEGRSVVPGFVDSHAHLVFAGERSAEFAARMTGAAYRAGGIQSPVAATRAASDAMLRATLRALVRQMLHQGTTTLECKSG